MDAKEFSFWATFESRDDLKQFGVDALLLFALQLRFGIEDISVVASNSLTEGSDDKKADLIYIDSELGRAVIAQAYMSEDMSKTEALRNKASDLNTAVSWLLNPPIGDLPISIRSYAEELRQAIKDGAIRTIYIWYVHNLPESVNVKRELETVEHTAISAIQSKFSGCGEIEIQALEVGTTTLEEWYKSISTPIRVAEEFTIPISGGFEISGTDWKAFVTSIPAGWLYGQFQSYKTDLFSADVREYLGSREADANINNGIKQTARDDPSHFWVYNNGITVLVNRFEEGADEGTRQLCVNGFSIVNGAQTIGAIGSLDEPPDDDARVQVRFITCSNADRLRNIVLYNNSQNKLTAPDFRSNDPTQTRLVDEFKEDFPFVEYLPRRGGHEDVIRRTPNALPSVVAGQALAAFHGDPDIAYHKKTHMWVDDTLYSTYFGEQTTAKHIIFAYSLLKAVEKKKLDLRSKSKDNGLTEVEKNQLDFFRERGSTFLMTSAIARCLEIFLNKPIPNLFRMSFGSNLSPEEAISRWSSIVEVSSSFAAPLMKGLADGFKTRETVQGATMTFQNYIDSTKQANATIYSEFAKQVN